MIEISWDYPPQEFLVHGAWADASSWGGVIPILQKAGNRVIAVELPEHSLADDVATAKRAINLVGGPVTLVGHSYGGMVITKSYQPYISTSKKVRFHA